MLWVQVPQWSDDWSKCAVDIPDASCHWYITAPDNTFGEGFDWASAPWFDANGLSDVPSIDIKGFCILLYCLKDSTTYFVAFE